MSDKGRMKRRALWLDLVIVVVLAGATWFTRAYAANTFVTWDEPAWVYRSVHFLDALRRGDWASTLLVGHPGVITMWCGAGGLTWHTLVTGVVSPDQLTPILAAPEFAVHDPELLRQLVALLPYAKSGIVVLHAGILVALYAVMACLLDRRYALVAALVVLLDPFYMALSRVLHIDALTSSFMVLAVLSALVYCRRGQRWALVLSGVAGAMAALAKAYGVVAAPIVAGVLAWQMVGPRRTSSASSQGPDGPRIKLWLRALALWTLVALGSALVLWPALWASPLETVRGMVSLSFEYATDPGDATTSFFRGAMTTHPGLAFYPFAMYFRTTPLTLLGLVTALIGTVWQRGSERARWSRRTMLGLLAFAALYLGLISFAGKKFDRYALPALVALDIVAAVGWVGLLDGLAARLRGLQSRLLGSADSRILRVLPTTILCALLAGQGIWLLAPLGPAYYLSYYNPWAGGLVRAVETLPIGWGEGVERMGGYLSAKEDAADLVVATWAVAGIAPGFPGQVVVLTPEGIPQADYIVLYRGDVRAQQDLVAQLGEPEHVVEIGGVPYVWLYANTYHHDLTARIAEDLGGDDVVIANTLSLLDRQESGLEVTVLHGDSEGEIAEQLRRATRGASGLLYVSFTGIPDTVSRTS